MQADAGLTETLQPDPPVQTVSREVTVEEALALAVQEQQRGYLDIAEDIYRKVLTHLPGHPDASHFLGMLLSQRGEHAAAAALIEAVVAEYPQHADAWSNLGLVYKAQGRLETAAEAFGRAIALDPRHANAYANRGILLRALGRLAEAEQAYTSALNIDPGHAHAHHNLGVLLEATGRLAEAVLAYTRAYVLDPANAESKRLLAHAYCLIGEPEKAVEIIRTWLAQDPDNPLARHLLAACSGQDIPARASDACVERLFDEFARTFDAKLAKLHYRAPQLTVDVLSDLLPLRDKSLHVVDAGCGTGLCGPLLAPFARRLVGVDLSAAMLEQARRRGVYDELFKEELTAFLYKHPATFDAIVSADTLVYFGDLEPVVRAMSSATRPGGVIAFTLEEQDEFATDEERARGFVLYPHGRYGHCERYVRNLMEAAQLRPFIVRAQLRMEGGKPVPGLVVCATGAGHVI
jgi:predicted TPR repeat methyltransferase